MSAAALDRQIKPIYDALDTGSNKSAIVACNKLLKKHPKNELVKSLKALALIRSQKVEESLVLCDEVLETKPTDDAVLTAMMHVLRGLGRHNDLVTMFEDAFKKQPTNEELGQQTFFANVRANHWKSAHQIATRMYKQFQEERYLYWSVISAVLQAKDANTPPTMRPILYKLAHRLIASSPTPSYVNAERFHLHLSILRELELWEEADKLIESDVGKSICSTSLACDEIRRAIMIQQGRYQQEAKRAEQLITEKKDRNWLEFLAVLDGTLPDTTPLIIGEADAREKVNHAQEIFSKIAEEDSTKDRSGLLALLDLEKRARLHGLSQEPTRMVSLLKQYFEKFGDKACCFEDLKPFVILDAESLSILRTFLEAIPTAFTTISELRRLINSFKLIRYTLSESEITAEKELIRVAAYARYTDYLASAPALALEHYRAMHIKQVQNDTLSHLILSRASTFSLGSIGDLTLLTECLESTQIYLSNTQETGDFIARAFQSEKYSQIPEFIVFEERLDNSLQRDTVKLEHIRMRIAHEPVTNDLIDMELIELKFIFDREHSDNRDFDILPNYQPKASKDLNEQTLLFGKPEGSKWLSCFLKVYIRGFQQASDIDDTVEEKLLIGDRPKKTAKYENGLTLKERLMQRGPEDFADLTEDEAKFIEYMNALIDWLEPYHNYARPPPDVVLAEAAKQTELKTGHPLKGVEVPTTNGHHKKDEEPPTIMDAPEVVVKYFDGVKERLPEAMKSSPSELLHVATLAQEAFLLLVAVTLRFKSPSVVKINKLSGLVPIFKTLRTNALSVLQSISAELVLRGKADGSSDTRNALISNCSPILTPQIDHDFLFINAKKIGDSRRKVLDGIGNGITRIRAAYSA
ncbi:N-alpha-acetyltransferase 25, NatB auxiliary subunit [Psilocybe cubensis]|uniref:N-alpha-acetyltransferase 25, NatB auxiliary subunit n=1 Tax=Psilocybe cubensis TaxID=181762 RepID=A0ACB8H9I8_PSICU|nr:N-alpha-acetyltransferase 25, NatB auxiliary subunit [Psilocybe cubensis]KAH9484364.1 N-alpha-acetyltransferase 25, NatB auxiliary subunit [Psilocybe cubensis]